MRFWRKLNKLSKDILERVVLTYVETAVGLVIAANTFADGRFDLDPVQFALVAAIPAALSAVKSWLASFRGNVNSGSLAKSI